MTAGQSSLCCQVACDAGWRFGGNFLRTSCSPTDKHNLHADPDDGILIRRTQQTHSGRAPSGKIKDPARLSLMKSLATGEFVVSDLFKQRVVHGLDDPNESDQKPCCCEMTGYHQAGHRHHILPEGEEAFGLSFVMVRLSKV